MPQRITATRTHPAAEQAPAHLADAYGTTIDGLAGRRAYRGSNPLDDLPQPRSSW